MKKVEKGYSLFCGYIDTVEDFINEKKDKNFIPAFISYRDKDGDYAPEYFDVILTEKEFNILKDNPFLGFEVFTEERGKAGLFDTLMGIAEENCTTDLKPIAPLTYILSKDENVLDIKDKFKQSEKLKQVLTNHIIKRGYLELEDEFKSYFNSIL